MSLTRAPLFHFLRLRAHSDEDAEELCQETFLRAWQRIDRYDRRWRFHTWLFTVGRRLMISRYRKGQHKTVGEDVLLQLSGPDDPSRVASEAEERTNLWDIARRVLSDEQCTALWLRYAEDLASKEVARVLGRREATVRVLLFRARERLSAYLRSDVQDRDRSARPAIPLPAKLAEVRP